jgi:hypothetical protein
MFVFLSVAKAGGGGGGGRESSVCNGSVTGSSSGYNWAELQRRGRDSATIVKSNHIKGKFCVFVRYRTYLNVFGMGSKLPGVLSKTLR